MNTIRRIQRAGNGNLKELVIIKGFKDAAAMHRFLSKQAASTLPCSDNNWRINSEPGYVGDYVPELAALKPGTYAFAGGKYHNTKRKSPKIMHLPC